MKWLHPAIMIAVYSAGLIALGIEGLLVAWRRSDKLRAFFAFHLVYTVKIVLSGLVVMEESGLLSLTLPTWFPIADWSVFLATVGALVVFLYQARGGAGTDRQSRSQGTENRRLRVPALLLLLPNVMLWFSPWLFPPEIDHLLFIAFPSTYLGVTVVALVSMLRELPASTGAGADLSQFASTHNLSEREAEVVRRLLEGKSNAAIAEELYVSLHTVKRHIYNVFKKTASSSRFELTRKVER
ncbi:MAG: response regulator transcription factor [Spirochaetota bacterium]